MNALPLPPPEDTSVEVSALIETLHKTEQRLEELTAGEVDAVADNEGRTFLLRHAQDRLRHSEAAKQHAILNALPAHVALLDTQGRIVSVNEAWRRFNGSDVVQRAGYAIGLNYLEVCESAQGAGASEAHQAADGIRSVLAGQTKNFSLEYSARSSTDEAWFLLTVTPLADDRRNGAVVMHLNITEQKRSKIERSAMEAALFVERNRAQVTLNSIGDAVACTDISGNITFLNPVAQQMTGWSLQEAVNKPIAEVVRVLDARTREIAVANPQTAHVPSSSIMLRRDGSEIPIEDSAAPIHDYDGQVTGAVIVFRDVSATRAMALQIAYSANHDFLTNLPNRLLLSDRIGHAIALARRHKKRVGVLFMDLDGFKHINDSLGHRVGDKLLQSVAGRLAKCIRSGDTVSRQGGDEFVLLLSEVEGLEEAAIAATRMLAEVANVHSVEEQELHITTSIGISIYPDDGVDAETLIRNADTAMYQAKENGRQSYRFFESEMNVRAVERQSMEAGLRRALERQEFALHYQPKIDLTTGRITGAEALLRWMHPTQGQIPPVQFIPIAEACGLILPIGAWVLRQACHQAQAWNDAGLPPITMAVNVSAMEFRDNGFLERVILILRETGLNPALLEIELTESVLMKQAESTAAILKTLRDKGVQVAIDDFGTGYSSLSYLRKFPVDALKIDRSFIQQIGASVDDATIVTAVIGMARSLKLRVVAEGVETQDHLEFLRSHQCDEAQGYYFSRPVPSLEFARLLEAGIPEPAVIVRAHTSGSPREVRGYART